jgi:hypothetical protein
MTIKASEWVVLALAMGLTWSCRYREPKPQTGGTSSESSPSMTEHGASADEASEATSSDSGNEGEGGPASHPTETTGACDDRACTATEDCCDGYACGFDPARSRVQRFCLAQ